MARESQQPRRELSLSNTELPDSLKQTLVDVDYFHAMVVSEAANLRHRIRQDSGSDVATQLEALIEAVATTLGEVSARVRLIEQVLAAQDLQDGVRELPAAGVDLPDECELSADQLGSTSNLLALEHSADGVGFRWTGEDPRTTFEIPVSRATRRGLKINVVAVVKPEYLQAIELRVDGQSVPVGVSYDGSEHCLSANLPERGQRGITRLELRLPATHSPSEVSDSTDARKLGVAISSICIGAPVKIRSGRRLRSAVRRLGTK